MWYGVRLLVLWVEKYPFPLQLLTKFSNTNSIIGFRTGVNFFEPRQQKK
jgi:hypothetical protein